MTRCYVFTLEDQPEGTTVEISTDAKRPDVEDLRVVIAVCCSLILRCAGEVDPQIIERVKRIQMETGLGEQLN